MTFFPKFYLIAHTEDPTAKAGLLCSRLIVFAMAVGLSGGIAMLCSGEVALPNSNDTIVISPTQHLFRGDLVRIWPHLGWIAAGCVEVEPADRALLVRINCQVWENGVKKADVPGPGVVMKRVRTEQDHEPNQKWEASISLKRVAASDDGNPRVEVQMVLQDGYTVATQEPTVVVVPRGRGVSGTKGMTEPTSASPSNTYAVWQHVMLPDPTSVLRMDPLERLADCAWGIVMIIEVEEVDEI
ncbi:MAG: hypothetical protein WCJ31_07355 [Planctomycetia bacterium]|nr:hypothetical protein [Planctomycetota bacterium]